MDDGFDPRWRTNRRSGEVSRRAHGEDGSSGATERPRAPRPHRRGDSGEVISRPVRTTRAGSVGSRPGGRADGRADAGRRAGGRAAAEPRGATSRARVERAPRAATPEAGQRVGEVLSGVGRELAVLLGRVRTRLGRRNTAIAGGVLLVVLVLLMSSCVRGCSGGTAPSGDAAATDQAAATTRPRSDKPHTLLDEGRTTKSGDGKVTFCAVGDNLMNENLLELCDGFAGTVGDGQYDFAPLYAKIKPTIQSYDIAFVNQETEMGGTEQFGYMGYPSYNTPDCMADVLEDTGFRVVNTNSNHTYDTWVDSILHQQELFSKHPKMMTVGSYASQKDRETPRVIECNGVRIAVLSYGYGQNGYEQSDLPNDFYAVPYTKEGMKADVERAREVSDFVLVYMHWGTEYTNEPNDEQREFAQYAADLGVGMVIGSHAHVIQPLAWVTRAEGSSDLAGADGPNDGKMLVAYGLGDFVSGYHNRPDTIMSGMLTCTFVRQDEKVSVQDVVWHPLIEHWANGTDAVMLASDYTEELANQNELLTTLSDPYAWIRDQSKAVIGDGFKVDM